MLVLYTAIEVPFVSAFVLARDDEGEDEGNVSLRLFAFCFTVFQLINTCALCVCLFVFFLCVLFFLRSCGCYIRFISVISNIINSSL